MARSGEEVRAVRTRDRRLASAELAQRALDAGRLGIDTEFVSEGRYRPLLCLVQVAVPDPASPSGAHVELLDPLAGFDHEPLADVVGDAEVEIVVHAAGQDVAILRRAWGARPRNIFDTQIAAGFAGFGAQAGYANLLRRAAGIQLSKSAGFTRWDQRPLSEEQLEYARQDVEDVLALADQLRQRLNESGRLEWVREECRRLEEVSDERDPELAYRRLPRQAQLRPRARAVARELAAWRERTAARDDRPLSSVLSDVALLELARRQPAGASELTAIRGLRPDVLRRRGGEIVDAVRRGQSRPPPDEPPRSESEPADVPLIALGESLVRARALEAGIAYELVASRADLAEIVAAVRECRGEPDVRTLRGWRRELAGTELLELLRGGQAVSVQGGARLRVEPRRGER